MLGIRFISRWVFRLVVIALILIIGGLLLIDPIAKSACERRIKDQTGLDVKIGSLQIGLINPRLTIENLVLYSQPEFGGGTMIDLPELHMEYDAAELRQGRLRLKLLRLHLAEMNVVIGKDGDHNFAALQRTAEERAREEREQHGGDPKLPGPGLQFGGIDMLNLTVGKFVRTDLRDPKATRQIDVDVRNEIFQDLKTKEDVVTKLSPIIVRTAAKFLMQSLFGGQ